MSTRHLKNLKELLPLPANPPIPPRLRPDAQARAAGFRRIAGVDEVGRGPWAGPVVAAAVILHRPRLAVRIDDSKRLTPAQRERACRVILEHAAVGIGIVCAEEIDRRNILHATFCAMQEAVRDLPTAPDLVLVDGHLTPRLSIPCWPIVRGDQRSYVIACASIVAKVFRDACMTFYHQLTPHYAFDRHKGYGTALHTQRLRDAGPSVFHRKSFAPVRSVMAIQAGSPDAHDALLAGSLAPSGTERSAALLTTSHSSTKTRHARRADRGALVAGSRLPHLRAQRPISSR
ncbi:MAG: ribonuclease HII [Candidatus Omnitrophica bacterium]|nr:ribonuclease HII [Candidatus Omnitrophota bacterium]